MASKHTSLDFNFQYYVDTVKQKKIPWTVFVNLMEDLSFSDVKRLKYLTYKLGISHQNLSLI